MEPNSPTRAAIRPPHPLALALIARLGAASARVLEIGAGSGRNTRALVAAGYSVCGLTEAEPCDGAISTHALLHGTHDEIAALLEAIAGRLHAEAPLFATFGSLRDSRFGEGTRIAERSFAPTEGDEIGVVHSYYDEASLRELLERCFTIESLEEHDVDDVAGSWAHERRPLRGAVHWFARVRKR